MKTHQLTSLILYILTSIFILSSGCIESVVLSDHDVEKVCFSTDIMPIIDKNCNSVGCHTDSDIIPKLSPAATAYNELFLTEMIDLKNPQNSELVKRMLDNQRNSPIDSLHKSTSSRIILQWIKQGAQID